MAAPSPPASDSQGFSLTLVSIDHYMAAPLPELDVRWSSLEGGPVQQVPVVRIFGHTPAGQKACLHVHQVR